MYISTFLVVSLAVSQTLTQPGLEIKEIGEDKDISDINKELNIPYGDILQLESIQRNGIVNPTAFWTSPVPYVLDSSLEMNAKGIIHRAFDQFRLKTCMDFKPRDSQKYYISVKKLGGCFSYIGKVIPKGQPLSIGRNCDSIAIVEHELIHALGFYHEQSRYDRDDHVKIILENIITGRERNFAKQSAEYSTTLGTPYDYYSVMHYGQNAFTNGNGSTIITIRPEFQDVIGQRLEMSSNDVLKLNRLYNCSGTVAFMEHCSFSDGMCGMGRCSRSVEGSWERVTRVAGGPDSDHTSLGSSRPNGFTTASPPQGFFMHSSTASGQEGDSAWLESRRMTPSRTCNVQCLQFYYYHSGGDQDQLNIWIREFQDERDSKGKLRLMGQITGPPTEHWLLHHVPLNATGSFQVEFEVRKGAGNSTGGFSIDDINLSETECPDHTWQIKDFENRLTNSPPGTYLFSPRLYSKEGYAFQIALVLYRSYFGMALRLVSGQYDDLLQWPCHWRQATFLSLDQNPQIQLQMSKQFSFTTDGGVTWDNPRDVGKNYTYENNEHFFVNTLFGRGYFRGLQDMKTKDFLKGGDAIFLITFQDISPLLQNNSLPCSKLPPVEFSELLGNRDEGPCSTRFITTTPDPPTTTTHPPTTTTHPPTTTTHPPTTTTHPPTTTDEDNSIFGFSPGMVCSPVLILLALLLLLAH